MLPDRVSNPGPLTYESGALPIALRGPDHVVWRLIYSTPSDCLCFGLVPIMLAKNIFHVFLLHAWRLCCHATPVPMQQEVWVMATCSPVNRLRQVLKNAANVNGNYKKWLPRFTTIQVRVGKCLTEELEILSRWTEYCSEQNNHESCGDNLLLNCSHPSASRKKWWHLKYHTYQWQKNGWCIPFMFIGIKQILSMDKQSFITVEKTVNAEKRDGWSLINGMAWRVDKTLSHFVSAHGVVNAFTLREQLYFLILASLLNGFNFQRK